MALHRVSVDLPQLTESPTMPVTVNTTTVSNTTSGPLEQATPWWDVILVTLWIIIMVISIVGNSMVFLAVAVSRSLQKRGNILVANILVADVLVCCLVPLQSATLMLADEDHRDDGVLPSYVCAGVATLATVCLWSRLATFGVLSHQQWQHHTKSRSLWASIYKRKRPLIIASLIWSCPLVLIVVPGIVSECVHLGYSENIHLCVIDGACDTSLLISRIVTPILWLLAVLFSFRNYYKIHIYEKNRRANKYVPRKKRRPNPRRDPEAYMTPKSPFEEVQLARPVTSFNKGKGKSKCKDSDKETGKRAKVSTLPRLLDFSRVKENTSKPEKRKVLGITRDDRSVNNPRVKTIDKELRMMFSRKQEHMDPRTGTFKPSTIRKKSQNEEEDPDRSEINERNSRNQDRGSGKMRAKLNSFVQKIHWKKSSTETMMSGVSQDDMSDVDNMDECDDEDDDDVIDEVVMGGAEDSATMHSSPNYNVNKTRMLEGKPPLLSFELHPVGSSRISSRGSSRKKSSPSDFVLSVSQLFSLLTLIYLVLILPKLICSLLSQCSPIFYKLAETSYVLISGINPLLLAFKHQTFSLVITGLVYRRWKSIPEPSHWIVRLCKIAEDITDHNSDGDCQL